MRLTVTWETEWGAAFQAPEPAFLQRGFAALADGGRVWLVDPVDGSELRAGVERLGRPAAVLQLLDRHPRDCALLARELGVPLLDLSSGRRPGGPFQVVPLVRRRRWREAALWWPERRTLVVADAVGTAPYFQGPGERLAVHPLLRLSPPRALAAFDPELVLVGHGRPLAGPATTEELRAAIDRARRGIPRWLGRVTREQPWRRSAA